MAPHCFINPFVQPSSSSSGSIRQKAEEEDASLGCNPDGYFYVSFRARYIDPIFIGEEGIDLDQSGIPETIGYSKREIPLPDGTIRIFLAPETVIYEEYFRPVYRIDYIGHQNSLMEYIRFNIRSLFFLERCFYSGDIEDEFVYTVFR